MVSLTRSFNTNIGGAAFFSESLNMEERQLLQPILESYGVFKPLPTIPIFSFHLVFTLVLDVVAIVYAIKHPDEKSKCREYFIIIYLHIGLWFFTLVLDQFVKCKHHSLRLNGYLEFYQKTLLHISLPLYIISLWSVMLLLVQTLMQHFYPDDFAEKCIHGGTFSPISYISAFLTLEVFVIAGVNINYIVKVRNFNKQKPPPDVQREEWITCANPENLNPNEIGYKQLGDKVVDLLEKQADLIRHLREHNARLGEKLMVLSAQLQQARIQQYRQPQLPQQQQHLPQQQPHHSQKQLHSSQEELLRAQEQFKRSEEQLQQPPEQLQHPPESLQLSQEQVEGSGEEIAVSNEKIVEIHPPPSEEKNQQQ